MSAIIITVRNCKTAGKDGVEKPAKGIDINLYHREQCNYQDRDFAADLTRTIKNAVSKFLDEQWEEGKRFILTIRIL